MIHWAQQALLWETLASTSDAGLTPDRSLALAAEAAGGTVGRRVRIAAARVALGTPMSDALEAAGEDRFACAIIRVGEQAGRLPPLARQLAESYRMRAKLRDDTVSRMIYPTILIHVALLLLPLPWVISGAVPGLTMLLGPGLLWLGVVGTMVVAWWSGRAGILGRLALRAPCAALCWPALAADLTAVLRAAIGAGMLAPRALELAASACANRTLSVRLSAAAQRLSKGDIPDLSTALAVCGLRHDLLELIRAGEVSGKLELALGQASTVAAERFAWRLGWTARLVTGTAFAVAVLTAVATIMNTFYQTYAPLFKELAP